MWKEFPAGGFVMRFATGWRAGKFRGCMMKGAALYDGAEGSLHAVAGVLEGVDDGAACGEGVA